MRKLGQVPAINQKIGTASKPVIIAMHRFVFEEDGDRNNRRRLREFNGFTFKDDSPEFAAKMQYAVRFTIGDLISICNVLGLEYAGNAEQLRERILRALMDVDALSPTDDEDDMADDDDVKYEASENELDDVGEADGYDEEDEDVISQTQRSEARSERSGRLRNKHFVLSYRDVEDSVRSFNGTDSYPIERWISDFEEAAVMFGWNDLQKVVFAKKSLKGVAKLFIQSESVIKTWKKLKDALTEKFSTKINSAQLHKMLERRRMKKEKTIQEYFFAMRELASRGSIESDALFDYVINGINDEITNKQILYGAKTVREFKDKLDTYEKIKKSSLDKTTKQARSRNEINKHVGKKSSGEDVKKKTPDDQESGSQIRCYNCGMNGHHAKNCDKKSLGKKCFSCNKFGHEAKDCEDKKKNKAESEAVNLVDVSPMNVCKSIVINDVSFQALLDTGSAVSLLREDAFRKLGKYTLVQSSRTFSGFGGGESKTLGYFQTIVFIDGEDYPLTLYVVPHKSVNMEAIIGRDILEQADVSFGREGVIIFKKSVINFLAQINITEESRVDVEHIPDIEIRDRVKDLIHEYKPKKHDCKTTGINLKITLKNENPIYQRPRRLAIPEKEIVEKQVQEWIEEGIVEPCSSEYASPVVVVRKKDGSPRVCIDYRPLNRIIERDRHPLPLIEDEIDKLKDAQIFCTLDLKNAFFMWK